MIGGVHQHQRPQSIVVADAAEFRPLGKPFAFFLDGHKSHDDAIGRRTQNQTVALLLQGPMFLRERFQLVFAFQPAGQDRIVRLVEVGELSDEGVLLLACATPGRPR